MPEQNPENPGFDPTILSAAVADGLARAMENPSVKEAIAKIIEHKDKGDSGRNLSTAEKVQKAVSTSRQRFTDGDERHTSGVSSSASRASRGLLAGLRGEKLSEGEYYSVPPGFGNMSGRITAQNVAQMIANRQYARIENAAPGSAEQEAAIRGYNRASYFQNELIPMAKAGQQFYRQFAQPTYRKMQDISAYGGTQITGPVGGNIGTSGFGFRNPFNAAFSQGLGIKMHQMGEALAPGLNMQQMQQIDNTLFGMGFNFNNPRFSPMEKALENITQYNPAIDTGLAGQTMNYAGRYGTTEDIAKLTSTIENLGKVAAGSNVSITQLQQQIVSYQQTAGMRGGLATQSGQAASYLAERFPGMDPSMFSNLAATNPMVQQYAMKMGYQSYQVGAMNGKELSQATMGGIGDAWKQITGRDIMHLDPHYLNTKEGRKALGTLQGLYGFNVDANQLQNLIKNEKNRQRADSALTELGNIKTHKYKSSPGPHFHDAKKYHDPDQADLSSVSHVLATAGYKKSDIDKIMDDVTGPGGTLKQGWRDKIRQKIDQRRTGDKPAKNDIDRMIKSLNDAANAAKDWKNNNPDPPRKNGG
jgi:hypothetical protein